MTDQASDSPETIVAALVRLGLAEPGDAPAMVPLTGGVSSDIWRIELAEGPVCVKRALPRLKVEALWEAPVERNRYEAAWMRAAGAIVPGCAPRLLAEDPETGLFVMEYLDEAGHPLWKSRLRDGEADLPFAREVGATLVRIHAGTAADPRIPARFPTDEIFHAIRLEPYLLATGQRHPDLATRLGALADRTARTRRALVHGDVSPKNILKGPGGPIFLDAECAWFGDPAFDLAFCLNHMLLKCLWTPAAAEGFLACFDAMAEGYLAGVDWEPAAGLEGRIASLLPALFLARVDGKSPVEYVTEEDQRARVRKVAIPLIVDPPERLAEVRAAWAAEVS